MRVFFSVMFVIILLLPPLAGHVDLQPTTAAVDTPPAAPRWEPQALNNPEYYDAWQHYLKRWATRLPLLVKAKRWLDYRVFAMTDVEGIHVGNNGWLYDDASVTAYRKNGCGRQPYVRQLITVLQTASDLARTSGRKFIVSVVPDKSTIYPEFMNRMPRQADCDQSLYDIWSEEQTRGPLDCYVSLEPSMQAAKQNGALLFSKTGSSWTPAGAEIASRTLLDALFTNGSMPPPEEDLASRLLGYTPDNNTEKTGQENRKHLSSVLVYGSAEAGQLLPHLAHGFDRVDLIVSDTLPSHDHHENIADYEAVVLMIPESRLADVRIDMDRWCTMLSADTLAGAENSIPLGTIQARQQISIDAAAGGLAIKSLGPHSYFQLPALPGSRGHTLRILKLEMETTHADQLTWVDNSEPPVFGSRAVRPGDTRHYIPLPRRPSVRLEINPGRQTGIFRLWRAVILEFDLADGIHPAATRAHAAPVDQAARPAAEIISEQPSEASREAPTTAPQTQSSPAVALHDFQEGRIFQRTGQAADIVVSGTYSGPVKTVEARVVRAGSNDIIVPWTVIDQTPKDGIFMGILPEVPQGGWYRVAVRVGNRPEILDRGEARWGVGMLVACIGQSNMEEWFHSGSNLKPHSLAGLHRNGRWRNEALTGNGAVSFANRLIGKLGIPVGILDYAVNGSGLRKEADWGTGYWADQSEKSIYRRFIRGVTDAGGAVEYVIWMQGEADAARGTITEHQYRATLTAFVEQQVRADIVNGSRLPHLPFLILGMPRRPIGRDGPHQAVRVAQRTVTEEVPDCYQAAVTMDLKNLGRQHLAPEAYTTLGLRAAQTVLFLLGEAPYYRGPSVAGAQKVDDHRVDIRLLHRGGNDFGPEVGITGWQVLGSAGPVPIAEVLRMDSRTIRIRLAEAVQGPLKLRYLYGAMPDAERPVHDNSAMELPLEPFEDIVR
jgi:hypothetical protein